MEPKQGAIIHSHWGRQYAGNQFRKRIHDRQLQQYLGWTDNQFDNVFMNAALAASKQICYSQALLEKPDFLSAFLIHCYETKRIYHSFKQEDKIKFGRSKKALLPLFNAVK